MNRRDIKNIIKETVKELTSHDDGHDTLNRPRMRVRMKASSPGHHLIGGGREFIVYVKAGGWYLPSPNIAISEDSIDVVGPTVELPDNFGN